ncbi:MAG: amidohydrolase family protein [candidate division Zixibacteria bacterium]|nr:amidohydrolase family protein [candidate division Zixibacteria bacterium]
MKPVRIFLIVALFSILALASDQIPAPPQSRTIALTGGFVHPVSSTGFVNGTVIFTGGKITAVGKNIPIPPDATVIDASGKHIYPGIIDAYSVIGLIEVESVRGTRDIEETGRINPNVRAEAAVNPESEIIPVTRANGVTTALVTPRGGTISGQSALMMLDGWTWEDMLLKAPVGMHLNWPSLTINTAWWVEETEEEQKAEQKKALEAIEDALKQARAYKKAKQSESKAGVPFHNTDLRWEAMIPVLEKKIPLIVSAWEARQIQDAIAWAEQEDLRIIIWGGYDSWRVAALLKSKNIPVIISGTHNTPNRSWEAYDLPYSLPKKLYESGVRFCIAGGDASNERNLPYQAATAAAYGLPKDEALKALTLYPAQILGVEDRLGSLEAGKDATLIVTTGDPLETATQIEMEFIQGKKVDLTSRHTRLYDKYRTKYQQQKDK